MKRFLVLLACGFHTPASFEASVNDGGGNRVYFTGSPRQKGYDCTACHLNAPKQISATVDGLAGVWTADAIATITVTLVGEHAGFGTANNQNGFVAEFVDDSGATAGRITANDPLQLLDNGGVVAGEGKDTTMWSFGWTAPDAGRGPITLYLGMLDGNGAATPDVPTTDPGGDDIALARVRLCENAGPCDPPAPATPTESRAAGCNAGGSSPWLLALLLPLLLRRRWPLIFVAGCYAANAPGDCPDNVCGVATGDAGTNCAENWVCSSWEAPAGSDQATRTCVDKNNVGTTTCKPPTSATLPPLDLDFYKCRVHPIFQRGCGMMACHGTDTEHPFRIYTRGRWRNDETVPGVPTCPESGQPENLQMKASGTVMCEGWLPHTQTEWNKSFDSARSYMLGVTDATQSLLLREPTKGGLPHAQVKLFAAGDPDYETIAAWLGGARLGSTCDTGKN